MQKNFFIVLGIFVALLPFISIPNSYKTPVYIILGATMAIASYRERYLKKKLLIPHLRRFKKFASSTPIANDISVRTNSLDENATSKGTQQ
ncbi:MAG: hypothetical protein AAB513_00090 [Patescibacteria group bacterium]